MIRGPRGIRAGTRVTFARLKLILLDRGGGLLDENGERMSFVEAKRVARAQRRANTKLRRKMVRLASDAIRDGVGSVNLVSPDGFMKSCSASRVWARCSRRRSTAPYRRYQSMTSKKLRR